MRYICLCFVSVFLCLAACVRLPFFSVSINHLDDQLTNLNVNFIKQTNAYRFQSVSHSMQTIGIYRISDNVLQSVAIPKSQIESTFGLIPLEKKIETDTSKCKIPFLRRTFNETPSLFGRVQFDQNTV